MDFKDAKDKKIKELEKQVHSLKKELEVSSDEKLRLNAYLDIIAGIHWWKDKDGIYRGCNNAMVQELGLKSKSDIIGKSDYELPWADQADALVQNDKEVMLTGKIQKGKEEPVQTKNKELHIFMVTKAPLYNHKHEILGTVGCSVDITSIKKMEENLHLAKIAAESANHAKSEFLANISHDIRTPLTGIITFSRFLKEQESLSQAERKELAGDTYHASQQLLNLLNGVLEVVSADSATDHDLNLTSFNLKDLLEDLIQLEKPAVKSHHLELKHSFDENLPEWVVSDKMKVHRILLNLIGNAIKFTEKGFIKLSAKLHSNDKDSSIVVFSVEDTGIGIPDEAQPQVFERFYKVNPSYKGKYTGNGIGLNIVQTYLQLLGGQIDFHSTTGQGTTFFVTLTFPHGEVPQKDPEDKPYQEMLIKEQEALLLEDEIYTVENQTLAVDEPIPSTLKVLLIEDNPLALKSLKVLFMPYQWQIFEADNAEEAYELVKKEAFDLIITDIGLPGMQGDELVAKIRQLEMDTGRNREMVVALTGHAVDGELASQCKKAGVDELFKKPMLPSQLRKLLDPFIKNQAPEQNAVPKEKGALQEGKLGLDLPDTEAQLFEINHHPLLDLNVGVASLGSEALVKDILNSLYEDGIAPELDKLKKAHEVSDWDSIRLIAHKMKGGATFGTVRLYYALLYMERYIKAGHRNCAQDLYTQMLRVIDETVDFIDKQ